MNYALTQTGLILPEQIAKSVLAESIGLSFGRGAFRTARPDNKNTAGWDTSNGSADADTLGDVSTLRQQSRDLCRNDPLAAGAVKGVVTSVVATGIVPHSRIDFEYLGLSAEEASKWEKQAERLFAHAAGNNSFDLERRQNFWQQQALVYRARLESGDCFVVRRYKPRKGRMVGTCVQIIEADRVSTPSDKSLELNIRGGIELDTDGAPIAYHILNKHPGETGVYFAVTSEDYVRLPAYDDAGHAVVLPIINIERPSQTRGVPYLAPVIEMLKQLSRYSEAEITAAVISSLFAVFIKSPNPVSPITSAPMMGIPGAAPMQAKAGNGQLQKMQSGMMIDLAPGEEIQVAEAVRPNTAFDPFVTAILRQIGVALELPFEVLVKHFTASYSAARAALVEAWKFYRKERSHLVDSYCQPVWEWMIHEMVARGLLQADGFFDDPLKRAAWLRCDWIGAQAEQIDPLKEANAATAWNKLGVLSLQDIAAEQGRDWEPTHRQIVKENKMRNDAGLLPVDPQAQPKQAMANPPEPKKTDGAKK